MKRIKPVLRYKFLREGLKSNSGNCVWEIGKWEKHEGKLSMCEAGFHASKDAYHAFSYVQGEILALVECKGDYLKDKDKECFRQQRVIKAYKWTKKDSLKLAIFSAELVLKNFESIYPNDMRPREAIEAAKKVLFEDTEENRSTAESAARSAWSTRSTAWSTRSTAWSTARSAWSAAWSAWSAAWSAWSAARSAWSAARSAESAESAAIKKIQNYFNKLVKELEPIKP